MWYLYLHQPSTDVVALSTSLPYLVLLLFLFSLCVTLPLRIPSLKKMHPKHTNQKVLSTYVGAWVLLFFLFCIRILF